MEELLNTWQTPVLLFPSTSTWPQAPNWSRSRRGILLQPFMPCHTCTTSARSFPVELFSGGPRHLLPAAATGSGPRKSLQACPL